MLTYQRHAISNGLYERQLAPVECSDLPEFETISINVLEHMLLLILDRLPEGADVLGTHGVHSEDMTEIVTEHDTVKIEVMIKGA